MKTKQQAIQEDWERNLSLAGMNKADFKYLKKLINDDGFLNTSGVSLSKKFYNIQLDIVGELIRPKSLQGIDNNNGWIKIETEDDLPKDLEVCHFIPCNYKDDAFVGFIKDDEVYFVDYRITFNEDYIRLNSWLKSQITHYQPIEKRKPPIH